MSVNLVLPRQRDKILQKLGLFNKFSRGELTCFGCEVVLTEDSLGWVMEFKGRTFPLCKSSACMNKYYDYAESQE